MAKTLEPHRGNRDVLPHAMRLRQSIFDTLRRAFELFGFEPMDTPAFESMEVLTANAGPQAEAEIYALFTCCWLTRMSLAAWDVRS